MQPIFIFVLCSLEWHCYVSSFSYNSILQIVDVMGTKYLSHRTDVVLNLILEERRLNLSIFEKFLGSQILTNNHSILFLPGYTVVARCILVWIILFKIDRNTFESFPNIYLPPHSVIWKKNLMNYCFNLSWFFKPILYLDPPNTKF